MGLCTLAEVKLQLGKTATTDDTELQTYIDAVTAPIEAFCGTVAQATVTNEKHPDGGCKLFLRSERLAAITTVTEFQGTTAQLYTEIPTPATAGAYTYVRDGTVLTRLGSGGYESPFTGPVYVTYTAGFPTVPTAINLAARHIVQRWWETQRGNALSRSEDVPLSEFVYFAGRLIPEMLALYRRGPLVG